MNATKRLKLQIRKIAKAIIKLEADFKVKENYYYNMTFSDVEEERYAFEDYRYASRNLKDMKDNLHDVCEHLMLSKMDEEERYCYIHDCLP